MISVDTIKKDFPLLKRQINGKPIVYLDSTATALKPQSVIDAVNSYYRQCSANVFRGIYKISEEATQKYEESRAIVADFIHAQKEEIVFTRNTTESLNLLAYAWLLPRLQKGDSVVATIMEHHSNFVPWQQVAHDHGGNFVVWKCDKEGLLDTDFEGETE